MKYPLLGSALAALYLWPVQGALAQPAAAADSGAVASLRQHQQRALGYESGLYNGPEYVNYVKRYVKGHQFFESAEARLAQVDYSGASYTAVLLRYDLVRDQLVIKAPLGALDMHLVSEQVAGFTLDGHRFIRLAASDNDGLPLRAGFYDLLLDGPMPVLAARRKTLLEESTPRGQEGEITQENELFVYKNQHYYPVSSAGSVLRLFPGHRAALRHYLRAQGLRFRKKSREAAVVALVRQATTLQPVP